MIALSAIGLSQTVTISDPGFAGNYTTSGCTGVVTTGSVSNGVLTLTAAAAGTCTLTIGDSDGNRATVGVTVTALSVPVQ